MLTYNDVPTRSLLWPLYAVAWALTSGANVIRPNSEMFWLGIIDLTVVALVLLVFLGLVGDVDHDGYHQHRVRLPLSLPSILQPTLDLLPRAL